MLPVLVSKSESGRAVVFKLTATREIRASEAIGRRVPIIALTAHALATDRDRSIAVGCADFDTKPVDLSRLIGKIRACLMRQDVEAG